MMNLQDRIGLLVRLGEYMLSADPAWVEAKEKANHKNGWFIPPFVDLAAEGIANEFLQRDKLEAWTRGYNLPAILPDTKLVGVVMAGNIPLVGFHDLLCVFISGHRLLVKLSAKDEVLIRHLADTMAGWAPEVNEFIMFSERLTGCDAYIATGSNNSGGYFDYYFGKYPHIIRRNRSSVAILTGNETANDLSLLANDVFCYFGLGCRNVTKVFVPASYDFIPLIDSFKKYDWLADNHKYKNNYDYNLALHILNYKYYMSTEGLLVIEDDQLFSPISQLNYSYYTDRQALESVLTGNEQLQCVVGQDHLPFGSTQSPSLTDYADAVDTLAFLNTL